jgi:cobalt-precorrin 5A hydrolase / precorrin-3B C17-methyltransferase
MVTGSKTAIFYVTRKGHELGRAIALHWPGAKCARFSVEQVRSRWKTGNRLVFIMATGITVRTIAPLLNDKRTDPAVVVMDDKGRNVISLTGGHIGGANKLAREVADVVGGEAIITTASDVNDLPAIDLWAEDHGLIVENATKVSKAGTGLVDRGSVRVFNELPLNLPDAFRPVKDASLADIVVTDRTDLVQTRRDVLVLRPKTLIVGIGCNSGTLADEIESAVRSTLERNGLSFLSLASVATIDIKTREPGLVAFALKYGLPLHAFTADQLNAVGDVTPSPAAQKATGARAVAEPAALSEAGEAGSLVVKKQKIGNVTVAIARTFHALVPSKHGREDRTEHDRGNIFVVGTGPGSADYLTPRALQAIEQSDSVVGYGPYLDLISGLISGKEVICTGMAQEIDRCRRAIELAREGRTVSVVSGGDPGIFAMAGLVLELLKKTDVSSASPRVEVVPGISALNACAARLGAPLMHDFAAISLSDRLTSWQTIAARLDAAAKADFVIVLYNPKSKGRSTHIEKAREIIARHRSPHTPVGIVRAAMREDESVKIFDLTTMPFCEIDMQTTVIVGNSMTVVWNGLMITPRGYEKKKAWQAPDVTYDKGNSR